MDSSALFGALFNPGRSNETSNSSQTMVLSEVVPGLLEAVIPGYAVLARLFADKTDVNGGVLISLGILIFGISAAARYLWWRVKDYYLLYLTASVYFDDDDELFGLVMDWIQTKQISQRSRNLKAVSKLCSGLYDDPDEDESWESESIHPIGKGDGGAAGDAGGSGPLVIWTAKTPQRYELHVGSHYFRHGGRFYLFERRQMDGSFQAYGRVPDQIRLSCVGRSPAPVKQLVADIRLWADERKRSMTVVRRPELRYDSSWERVFARYSRPIDTVVLDDAEKERLLLDIAEYLHPSSARWYASRGIPYRRGYLFHGPPGTGKTSLSSAIAGIFGLDIHVASLADPAMTETHLVSLFNNLPRRCVILLEDMDAAGLIQRDHSSASATAAPALTLEPPTAAGAAAAAAAADPRRPSAAADADSGSENRKDRITLSGLLNAIDGVASHEGRVLIMTTNHPEALDEALVRPGRIDLQIKFGLASHSQIRQLFLRMYADDVSLQPLHPSAGPDAKGRPAAPAPPGSDEKANGLVAGPEPALPPSAVSKEELHQLAAKFTGLLPEGTFSPAEVQGFLLVRRRDPVRAVEQVLAWRDGLLESRRRKSKVVTVS